MRPYSFHRAVFDDVSSNEATPRSRAQLEPVRSSPSYHQDAFFLGSKRDSVQSYSYGHVRSGSLHSSMSTPSIFASPSDGYSKIPIPSRLNKGFYVVSRKNENENEERRSADVVGSEPVADADASPGTISAKAFRRSVAGSGVHLELQHVNMSSLSINAPPAPARRSQSQSQIPQPKNRRTVSDSAYDGIQQHPPPLAPHTPDGGSTISIDGASNFSDLVENTSFFREIMDSRPLSEPQQTPRPQDATRPALESPRLLSPTTVPQSLSKPFPSIQSSNFVRISRRARTPAVPEIPSKKGKSPSPLMRLFSPSKPRRYKPITPTDKSVLTIGARPSWITGTFVIDPRLRVPGGILSSSGRRAGVDGEKKNLVLEVENGGIDVTVRLVPSDSLPERVRYTGIDLRLKGFLDVPGASLSVKQQKDGKINSKKAKPEVQVLDSFPIIARVDAPHPRPPIYLYASTIDHPLETPQANHSLPTPVTPSNSVSVDSAGYHPDHKSEPALSRSPTAATIATKRLSKTSGPRPYHLPSSLASPSPETTYLHGAGLVSPQATPPFPASMSLPPSHSKPNVTNANGHGFSPNSPIGGGHPAPHGHLPFPSLHPTLNASLAPPQADSDSPIHLHLPLSFRGPITIMVHRVTEEGGVGAHVILSTGVQRQAVLLQETECGQVYFVGGLRRDAEDGETAIQDKETIEEEGGTAEGDPDHGDEEELDGLTGGRSPVRNPRLAMYRGPSNGYEAASSVLDSPSPKERHHRRNASSTSTATAATGSRHRRAHSRKAPPSDDGETIKVSRQSARHVHAMQQDASNASSGSCTEAASDAQGDSGGRLGNGGRLDVGAGFGNEGEATWMGDRVDLVVGKGKINLRFFDE
ncbi:hypothetical protein DFP72DRAFT_1169002 [Ephemerocybe angulata]|uniref:DUF7330 domain-containing protein n=1 Tax=Ephemerocybe angulata TaxID=980116 RepID=A0A8H6I1V5_9AGAR|nr:hypothetical protein DFP72DRAFT_1169002 [Tulosesus angulatus]